MANNVPPRKPAMDEWGVYDPQQAGLAALFAKLDGKKEPVKAELPSAPAATAAPRPSLSDAK